MKKVISVSRRTDIPAFYGEWFMKRLSAGRAGYVNPYGGQRYLVSLKQEDVICFVFWSKNFLPFIDKLKIIKELGYNFYFNYTITGLPRVFEHEVETQVSIDALKQLKELYSPRHINWRYDPIVLSSRTPYEFHVENFERMASELQGYVERCYFSYAIQYGKVKRNFEQFEKTQGISMIDPDVITRKQLADQLARIAHRYGITMYTCCGDMLVNEKIKKAHCVDGDIIEELFHPNLELKPIPTRKGCGCTISTDIGTYDTCPHGCIYCYANINKQKADLTRRSHDLNSAFLGYTEEESVRWEDEIHKKDVEKETTSKEPIQSSFF